jgi:hypothetical protein
MRRSAGLLLRHVARPADGADPLDALLRTAHDEAPDADLTEAAVAEELAIWKKERAARAEWSWSMPARSSVLRWFPAAYPGRPWFGHRLPPGKLTEFTEFQDLLFRNAAWFEPATHVTDCHDPKDNKYHQLALAFAARILATSDADLRDLHP